MKRLPITLWLLSVLVLLNGCSGVGSVTGAVPSPAPTSPNPTPPNPNPTPPNPGPTPAGRIIAGNWNLTIPSAVSGISPKTIAGSITQSGTMLGGVVHVNGSNCFDYMTAISLSGDLTEDKVYLTSAAVDGQVITVTGNVSRPFYAGPDMLAGTYTIRGGCADGDQGSLTGEPVSVAGNWGGNFMAVGGTTFYVNGQLAQDGPSSEGSSGISGPIYTENPCLKSGTLTPGTFPDGSYTLGSSVALEIETDNGVMTFLGTADGSGLIRGIYKVDSGPCISTGTGYFSPWE